MALPARHYCNENNFIIFKESRVFPAMAEGSKRVLHEQLRSHPRRWMFSVLADGLIRLNSPHLDTVLACRKHSKCSVICHANGGPCVLRRRVALTPCCIRPLFVLVFFFSQQLLSRVSCCFICVCCHTDLTRLMEIMPYFVVEHNQQC